MASELTPDRLRAFLERRWDLLESSKRDHWAADANARGPAAGLEISCALWQHARRVDPAWPSEAERRADLEHHTRFAAKLRRLSDVLSSR